jgi:hypothetical protein
MNSREQAARAGRSVLQLVCQGESVLKMRDKFTALLCRVFMPFARQRPSTVLEISRAAVRRQKAAKANR